jgi:hypothetical protein
LKTAKIAVAIALLFLLAGSSPVFAEDGSHGSHQNLSLTLSGGILNSGTQHYSHSGGDLVAALVGGLPIDLSGAELRYSLHAVITGLDVQGQATFNLAYSDSTGAHIQIEGSAPIDNMVPAEVFPFWCNFPGVDCTGTINSAIPGLFLGTAAITTQTCQGDNQGGGDQSQKSGDNSNNGGGDNSNSCRETPSSTPMQFESAFLNPFGGPIIMGSSDGKLVIVATYSHARVTWDGIQMGGSAKGQISGDPVTGKFAMMVSATEDLKQGHESDRGTIVFSEMSNPSLDAAGKFSGESTIPPGISDCSALTGFPGTCHLTGFHSEGHFSMKNASGDKIKGEYSTEWMVPAVAFTSTVTADLK